MAPPHGVTPTLEQQRQFWNWHWDHWAERRVINEWTLARWEALLDLVRSLRLKRPRILDLGCGRGWFTARLAELGDATGLDLSDEAIAAARAEFPQLTFIAGNVYDSLPPKAHFDVVLSQEVIAHVEESAGYVAQAADALRPGGYLVVSTGNKFVIDRIDFPTQPAHHIARQLSMRALKRLLRSHFDIVRAKTIIPAGDRGVLRIVNSYRLNKLLSRVIPQRVLDRAKERAGLGYQLLVVARKRA